MGYVVHPSAVHVGPAAWFFLVVVCVLLPLAVVRQHRSLTTGTMPSPSRWRIYAGALVTHAFLLLMVWLVTRAGGFDPLPPYRPAAFDVVVGIVALALGLLPMLRRFSVEDATTQQRTLMIAPRGVREYGLFYLVSLTAGIAEQLAFRGVLFTLLAALLGGWWIPAILSAAVFGVVHFFQGWRGAAAAGVIGLRDQIVVGLTGTLFVAIVIHVIHDVVAGTVLGLRARRDEPAAAAFDVEPTPVQHVNSTP